MSRNDIGRGFWAVTTGANVLDAPASRIAATPIQERFSR
jgi:hypothetical protein